MNRLTPYEQSLSEQLTEVPVPSEDKAWLQMKKLLDEDNGGSIIYAPSKRGCSILPILIAILLIGGGIYFFTHQSIFKSKEPKAIAGKASKDTTGNKAISVIDPHKSYADSNDPDSGIRKASEVRDSGDSTKVAVLNTRN